MAPSFACHRKSSRCLESLRRKFEALIADSAHAVNSPSDVAACADLIGDRLFGGGALTF